MSRAPKLAELNDCYFGDIQDEGRIPARQDRDRILYSAEFRLLAGVTQVASATEQLLIHNRITHSTKVEQVGAAIVALNDARARSGKPDTAKLGADTEWRVAAAGLSHDLGHPPFGHIGEDTLSNLLVCKEHLEQVRTREVRRASPCNKCLLEDGFEGNAQSFRIVTKLTVRANSRKSGSPPPAEPYRHGLNLTKGVLQATTKYPWLRGANAAKPRKWGAYDCDADMLKWTLAGTFPEDEVLVHANGVDIKQSLEAEVMDWADDITYAVHDIDDFYRLGLVPLNALREPGTDSSEFLSYAEAGADWGTALEGYDQGELRAFVANTFAWFPGRPFSDLPADVAHINGLVSELIDLMVTRTHIRRGRVEPEAYVRYLNVILKQLTWYYVIDNPALASIQEGQRRILQELFQYVTEVAEAHYLEAGSGFDSLKSKRRLPALLRYYVDWALRDEGCKEAYPERRQRLTRGVVDFLASLTDRGAHRLHARLAGDVDVSIMEPNIAV